MNRNDRNALTRRRLLQGTGAAALALASQSAPAFFRRGRGTGHIAPSPLFPLGVASGDPGARSVQLWTRLADDVFADLGGLGKNTYLVRVAVALDPDMRDVIARRPAIASWRNGFNVNVTAFGLPSDCWLYYRFEVPKLGAYSPIGRTRTFPAWNDPVDEFRFGLVSCQNYPAGYYVGYRDMLDQDLDCVIHTGDYIYENAGGSNPTFEGRNHDDVEIFSVEDYRRRYAIYRLDPDLQAMHAQVPFLVTWDDHEVDNNFAGDIAEETAPFKGDEFLTRKRNALQVYREVMPLRPRNRILRGNDELRIYREMAFGSLASIYMLDTRQYRDDQPAGDGFGSTDPRALEPAYQAIGAALGDAELFDPRIAAPGSQMLGMDQEAWLAHRMMGSSSQWNILAQGIMQMRWNLNVVTDNPFTPEFDPLTTILNVDAWDGYLDAQRRFLNLIAASKAKNPVVLTGDIHSFWGANLLADYDDPNSDVVAAEFVCSGMSSTFGGADPRATDALVKATVPANPWIKYFEGRFRGYQLCTVTPSEWTTQARAVQPELDGNGEPVGFGFLANRNSPVATDAVLKLPAGFNVPGSGLGVTRIA